MEQERGQEHGAGSWGRIVGQEPVGQEPVGPADLLQQRRKQAANAANGATLAI